MSHTGGAIFGFIILLVHIAILAWVYSDANEKGHSGCLWAFLVFFFGLFALAAYLIFFHGFPATTSHRAVDRSEDLQYRSKYRGAAPPSGSWQSSGQWGQPSAMTSAPTADPGFRDDELDKLISEGKLTEARAYLRDMQAVAREMGDTKGLANYRLYEGKISRAASSPGKGTFGSRY